MMKTDKIHSFPLFLTRRKKSKNIGYLSHFEKKKPQNTVWKFQDLCIIQILCEINFEDSRSAKLAISTHLEALNFDFHEVLHFLKVEIYQVNKIHSP